MYDIETSERINIINYLNFLNIYDTYSKLNLRIDLF